MKKVVINLIVVCLVFICAVGCNEKPTIDISMDEYCISAINEIQDHFDNFGDGNYDKNKKMEWLDKYLKYQLSTEQTEYYDMIKESHDIFLAWQEAQINNDENKIKTQAQRMSKQMDKLTEFIDRLE